MENNPLSGFFGVSSPRPEAQRFSPQPTAPTENICYEMVLLYAMASIHEELASLGVGVHEVGDLLAHTNSLVQQHKIWRLPSDT